MGDNPQIELQQGPLVSVTFQKKPSRKEKYLEAKPKALGIAQIGFSVYQLSWVYGALHNYVHIPLAVNVLFICGSIVVMMAGILAIVAKNLHIPTLRSCLAVQIMAVIASLLNLIMMLHQFEGQYMHTCWIFDEHGNLTGTQALCEALEYAYGHCYTGGYLLQMALLAISVTLTAYCCKVINCCSPTSRMPVIVVQAPVQAPPPPQPIEQPAAVE